MMSTGLCKAVTCYGESRRTHVCAGLCVRHSRVLEGLISHLWLTDYVQAGKRGLRQSCKPPAGVLVPDPTYRELLIKSLEIFLQCV